MNHPTSHYPTSQEAIEAGTTLVRLLRDGVQQDDIQPGLHAAWIVAGGALGMIVGEPDAPPHVIGVSASLSDSGKAEAIESATKAIQRGDTKAIPWGLVLEIALKLIERFIKK